MPNCKYPLVLHHHHNHNHNHTTPTTGPPHPHHHHNHSHQVLLDRTVVFSGSVWAQCFLVLFPHDLCLGWAVHCAHQYTWKQRTHSLISGLPPQMAQLHCIPEFNALSFVVLSFQMTSAWVGLFIVPINAVINPYLFTYSTGPYR